MSDLTVPRLEAGDRAPPFIGISAAGKLYSFEMQAGRTVVMVVMRRLGGELAPIVSALSASAEAFAALEADLVAMVGDTAEQVFEFNLSHPGRVTLVGSPNDFLERIGVTGDAPEILVLDRNQRVAARIGSGDPDVLAASALAVVERLPREEPRDVYLPAPVLIMPYLFDLELCRRLIELHETNHPFDSPVVVSDMNGQPQARIDHGLKKRYDVLLDAAQPLYRPVIDIITRRCVPEIHRCFQASITHSDAIFVACYPGGGGHFSPHRDDRPAIVAHRRFALSVNLTLAAGGYEGGHFRLPEFNWHHYRCPPGAGVIFSVALQHEVTPVVSGNRYVLVTHLYDETGEAQRLAYRTAEHPA